MKKDELLIIVTVIVAVMVVSICSFEMGRDAMKREAVVAGHAVWAYDEVGHPKFHWKEQQTVIGEYLGLGK